MTEKSARHEVSRKTGKSRIKQALMVMFMCAGWLAAASLSHAMELKDATLRAWDEYVQAAHARTNSPDPFLWVDEMPERAQQVRDGKILVEPAGPQIPKPIPSGLIHDWIGAVFVPGAKIEDIMSAVRDYDNYKSYYEPTVVESRLLSNTGSCERYSMRVVNSEVVAHTALDMEYETCYFKINERRWYSITHTTRVQEVRHYGQASERDLPPNQGSGYVWRLYSVARFEQRDEGTYVEVEAMALSRDIPAAVRWFVDPIVRRVSRNSILLSLKETEGAVRSKEDENRKAGLATPANDHSRAGFAAAGTVINGSGWGGKP